jgi:hypothetical protein
MSRDLRSALAHGWWERTPFAAAVCVLTVRVPARSAAGSIRVGIIGAADGAPSLADLRALMAKHERISKL